MIGQGKIAEIQMQLENLSVDCVLVDQALTGTQQRNLEKAFNKPVCDRTGLIQDLPHQLVAGFRATLEETLHADLLFHIVDTARPYRDQQIYAVNEVLHELKADNTPQILIFNKVDLLDLQPRIEWDEYGNISRIWLSAAKLSGLELVDEALTDFFSSSINGF